MTSTSSASNCSIVETPSSQIACSILSHSSYSDIIDHVSCYNVQSIYTHYIVLIVACRDYSLQWSLDLHATIYKHHNSRALYQFNHHSILGMYIDTYSILINIIIAPPPLLVLRYIGGQYTEIILLLYGTMLTPS